MAKPKTKDELLELSQRNFKRLNDFIDSFSDKEIKTEFPKGTMNRNIRDVLAHLHHWHEMLLDWYNVGMSGIKPDMPAKGFRWSETPELNKKIWNQYKTTELKKVRSMLNESYIKLQSVIKKHTDEELFEKKRYNWTGTTSLAIYLSANTSSHYTWAYNLIKRAKQ